MPANLPLELREEFRTPHMRGTAIELRNRQGTGWTPLHWAALEGHKGMAELLLANKADVNAKDNKGYTPLYYAADKGHKDVVDLLRQHGGHE